MVNRTIALKTKEKIPYAGKFIRIEKDRVIIKPSDDSGITFSFKIENIESVTFANGVRINEGFHEGIEKKLEMVEEIYEDIN